MSEALKAAARAIFSTALQAVDVQAAVRSRIRQDGDTLLLADRAVPLSELDCVVVIAMGKAAVPMYMAAAGALAGLRYRAVVVGPAETLPVDAQRTSSAISGAGSETLFLPGAHPTPTAESLQAGAAILNLLEDVDDRTAVLFLISGGASAMVEKPLDPAISLEELALFSRALVGSGLNITAMNALRKHLSAVKGGRLAGAAAAARAQCTLLVSDVPAASPDAIGSGPSLPDSTTVEETRLLFEALRSGSALPRSIIRWFETASLPETPKAGDAAFARSTWEVVLSSDHLTHAAVAAAEAAGFHTVVDNACDDWDYTEAGRYLLDRSLVERSAAGTRPSCIISVGEVGVTTSGSPGKGGRNQQFAVWCAAELSRRNQAATVLSVGSDGIDGHSDAAGGVCDEDTFARAAAAGLSLPEALATFNTTPLLHALGDALYTGPTGNNLRDLRLILASRAEPALHEKGPHRIVWASSAELLLIKLEKDDPHQSPACGHLQA